MNRIAAFVLVLAAWWSPPRRRRRSAATCTPPKYPGSGYFTSLKVTKVCCATGESGRAGLPQVPDQARDHRPLHVQGQGVLLP